MPESLDFTGFPLRLRKRNVHREILLVLASGATLRRTIFTVACLIALVGSSFRPMPGPRYAMGSIASTLSEEGILPTEETVPDERLYYSVYQVQKGDTISGIAETFNVTVDTVFSANGIPSARSLKPGALLKIPSMAGIVYKAKAGESVEKIAETYQISADRLVEANGLLASTLQSDRPLFLPDAKLPQAVLRELSGDLFKWPVRGIITSWYSWRRDPFSGRNSFHNGLDIGVPMGTPVGAAMEGTVSETGYSPTMGRFVILRHPGGWQTLYAHLSQASVQPGQYVSRGSRIALSGNTGYSTGPHLHFTVYKNGKTVNPSNVLQ